MNQTKTFNSSLGTNMHKAARPSGSMVSSNSCRWRGKWCHHHGGGVCWLFVLLWIDSWHHELIVCKKWFKSNPKEGLCGVTFWPTLACTTPIAKRPFKYTNRGQSFMFHEFIHSWVRYELVKVFWAYGLQLRSLHQNWNSGCLIYSRFFTYLINKSALTERQQ